MQVIRFLLDKEVLVRIQIARFWIRFFFVINYCLRVYHRGHCIVLEHRSRAEYADFLHNIDVILLNYCLLFEAVSMPEN